jgi:[ribosomal protein S5]-alanine N-acetyltransferase
MSVEPRVTLVGERVILRLARPEDADALAQGFADDPTLGAMLGMEPDQENAAWLRSTFPEDSENGEERKAYWFAIDDAASGELIGEIGLVEISWPNRRAAVSILVLPGSRRAGVGREAIELLVAWAQDELGLHRIELHTLPENAPMQRLAEASGFMREGVLRDYAFERGRFVDNLVYARLPARPRADRAVSAPRPASGGAHPRGSPAG